MPDLEQLLSAGSDTSSLVTQKLAGHTVEQLKSQGYNVAKLKISGFDASDLRKANFTVRELRCENMMTLTGEEGVANISVYLRLGQKAQGQPIWKREDGQSFLYYAATGRWMVTNQMEYNRGLDGDTRGWLMSPLCAIGAQPASASGSWERSDGTKWVRDTTVKASIGGFSAIELKEAGCDATDLWSAGFSAAQLQDAGFAASELKEAGFGCQSLSAESVLEIKAPYNFVAGTYHQLLGGRVQDLPVWKHVDAEVFLHFSSFGRWLITDTPRDGAKGLESNQRGWYASPETHIRALPHCISGHWEQLGRVPDPSIEVVSSGFTDMQLKDAGWTASELRGSGFGLGRLTLAGFTAGELIKAGFEERDLRWHAVVVVTAPRHFAAGVYCIVQGAIVQGLPVWKREDAECWLHFSFGRWLLTGKAAYDESLEANEQAWIVCDASSKGTPPFRYMEYWEGLDGKWRTLVGKDWATDRTIQVRAIGLTAEEQGP